MAFCSLLDHGTEATFVTYVKNACRLLTDNEAGRTST